MRWDILAIIISVINFVVLTIWVIISTKKPKHKKQVEEPPPELPSLAVDLKPTNFKSKIEQELVDITEQIKVIESEVEAKSGVYEQLKAKHNKLLKVREVL